MAGGAVLSVPPAAIRDYKSKIKTMKKLFISFLLSLLGLAWANAQYLFECDSWGDYEALTDATTLTTMPGTGDVSAYVVDAATAVQCEAGSMAQATLTGIQIGFDFQYYGETYDKFAVAGNGYIVLGKKASENIAFSKNSGMLSRMLIGECIGVSSDISVYNESVSYKLTGEAGSRVLAVQFEYQYAKKLADGQTEPTTDDLVSYKHQIWLYESDNHIEIVTGKWTRMQTPDFTGSILNLGLKGSGTTCLFANYVWNMDYASSSHTDLMKTTTQIPQASEGCTFTFSIIGPCEAPTYTVNNITLTPKSNEMAIAVSVDTTGKQAEGYLVIASEQPIEAGAPTDGTEYKKGDALLGGTVIAVGKMSEFDPNRTNPDRSRTMMAFNHPAGVRDPRLTPNTTYYYAVYFVNTGKCTATYSEGSMTNGKTATTAPESLAVKSASLNEVKLSATANDLNEEIAILMTTGQGEDENGNRIYVGNFAPIPADAEVGDKFTTSYKIAGKDIVDTTVVLYKGAAVADITCAVNLANNRVYYFGAVSKGAESGIYSTFAANAEPYLTPAGLPFSDNFALNLSAAEEDKAFIGGWAGTENFEPKMNSDRKVGSVISTMGKGPDQAVLVMPALDFPTDSNVIVNIAYSLSPYGYNSDKVEGDSIALEISTDGGETFKVLKAVHKNTDNLNLGKVILSDYLGAEQAILRLRAVNANPDKDWNVEVTKISISALPFCPEPGNPYVSATYGGTLGLTWYASENNETQWNISTAPVAAEDEEPAWSRALVVNEKPYYLSGLADREIYNVRIQAICGAYVSGWVSATVQAGRVPTFTEDFNNLPVEEGYYGLEVEMPANWQNGSYYISSWSGPYTSWYSGINKFMEYKGQDEITEETTDYNGALAYDMHNSYGYVGLLKTPLVELNPAENPKFTFEAAFGTWADGTFGVMPEENRADTMQLAMWVCDTNKFSMSDEPAKIWKVAELATWSAGQKVEIDLSEYITEPKVMSVVMAIYTETSSGDMTDMLYLDNIGFVNTLPLARSVKVVSLSAEEATIRWVADPTVEEWIVKVTGGHLTAPRFYTATTPLQVVDDLIPEMEYTVAVSHIMNNDTVDWNAVTFMTPGMDCDEPTALAVSEISRKSAKLTWEGDAADGYRVRYRPVAKEGAEPMTWLEVEVEGTSYILNGLALETEYECGVQSVCNKLGEQESEYAAFDNFTTLGLTCFTPTEVRILEIKPKSIDISWTGTSDSYQVAWMSQVSGSAWTYSDIISGEAYTITGLDYYSFYTFKVRGVCSAGDSSEWSETRNFRTLPRQACPDPTNLRVEALTQTSATLLWDAEETEEGDIQSYVLRHRRASVQAWDSIKDVEGTTYAITGMEPKTAYVWAVMTACIDDRYSENWAQLRFETPANDTTPGDSTAVEGLKSQAGLYVAATRGQVYVMNPRSVQIDNIRIFSAMGQRLEQYAVRSRDNVILTTEVRNGIVIVEVESEGRFFRFKTVLP